MKFYYQVIDEPPGTTYEIEAPDYETAIELICREWRMAEDCIEMITSFEDMA